MTKKASAGPTSIEAWIAKTQAKAAKDARAAFDSGDYAYHASTKGLSTLTLIDDAWSFAQDRLLGRAKLEPRAVAKLAAEYRKAWRATIAELVDPPRPTTWTVRDGRLDLDVLGKVPAGIKGLASVQTLSLYGMRLPKLPPVVFTLPNVASAYLQANKLSEVPRDVAKWTRLRNLHLGSNPLTDADAVCALDGLRALDLSDTKLKVLPERIGDLRELEVLDLFQAKATWKTLPESFFALKKLKVVRVPLDKGRDVSAALRAAKMKARVVTSGAVMP